MYKEILVIKAKHSELKLFTHWGDCCIQSDYGMKLTPKRIDRLIKGLQEAKELLK